MAIEEITLFDKAIGISNLTSSYRQEPGSLEKADNIIISPSGATVVRRGKQKKAEGNFSSAFQFHDYALVVKKRVTDYALYRVEISGEDITLVGLRSGLSSGNLSYAPANNRLYYTNGVENGIIEEGISKPWPVNKWGKETKVEFKSFPVCQKIAYNAGIVYGAIEDIVYFSVYALPGLYRPKKDWIQLKEKVLELIPAPQGLFVSTTKKVYYFSGLNPTKWEQSIVLNYPIYSKSDKLYNLSLLGLSIGLGFICASERGPVVSLPNGQIQNLVEGRYQIRTKKDTIFVTDETLIIQT